MFEVLGLVFVVLGLFAAWIPLGLIGTGAVFLAAAWVGPPARAKVDAP